MAAIVRIWQRTGFVLVLCATLYLYMHNYHNHYGSSFDALHPNSSILPQRYDILSSGGCQA